ncbi:4Fe-4S binding protein [Lachnospira multipara]|uniref:4Fe-4S binding protein n=1 Tax=Lachnospira multipara TaxID=28051 RepID=UPI00041B6909|nr:4Fe-4S binding protein [Lachnospira multipara]
MVKRKAKVDVSHCVACGVCQKQCPRGAISIFRGCYSVVDMAKCVGCGICAKVCPADTISIETVEVSNDK